MESLRRRAIVATLWVGNTVVDLVQIVLGSMSPRWQADVARGQVAGFPINDQTLGVFAFSLVLPIAMAYVVLALPAGKLNKWLNVSLVAAVGLMSWVDFLARRVGEIGVANWVVALLTNVPLTVAVFYAWRLDRAD